MPAIYLTEDDVFNLINMEKTIELVEEAFKSYATGTSYNMPRKRLRIKKGTLHMLPAAIPYKDVLGFKAYTSFREGNFFKVFLYCGQSGKLLSIIEANELGRLRTGAASAVATKYMAKKNSKVGFIFGAGYQAEKQLEAIDHIMKLEKIYVSNTNVDKGIAFTKKMQQLLNTSVERVEDVSKYLYKADIMTTITWVSKPLFNDDWLSQDGVHINAAGSNSLIRSEIPEKTIERSALIAVDAKDIAELECGDILPSLEKGRLHFNELSELGDIVAGKIIGRKDEKDLTIFESHGMGLQDIICAEYIYKNAVKNKIGQNLPF